MIIFNSLIQLITDIITHVMNLLGLFFSRRKPSHYKSTKSYFKRGDVIEDTNGAVGRVWKVCVNIKTGKPMTCLVMWEEEKDGMKITSVDTVEDKSPKFNPVIRKVQNESR